MSTYRVTAKIWLYPGAGGMRPARGSAAAEVPSGWHFVSVPEKASAQIKEKHGKNARGWRSIPVVVTLGKSTWKTSIFPEKSGVYLLPLKAAIRLKEGIAAEDTVDFTLKIG